MANKNPLKKILRAQYRAAYGPKWFEIPEVYAEYKRECATGSLVQTRKKVAAMQFEADARAVVSRHTTQKHAFEGGTGVSCYVWVNGLCIGSNCLVLSEGFVADMKSVPGYRHHHVNLD